MNKELYYEDFEIGQQFKSDRSHTITRDNAIAFARMYDPQLQHIDEEAAKNTLFGKLIVSGWQTAAVTMRLKTETELFHVANGLVGMGLESVRWPRPTFPGDSLRIMITVIDKRPSTSRPDKGIVKYKVETFNQRNEMAMEMETAVIVPRRSPAR